jgi:hypothetical protein
MNVIENRLDWIGFYLRQSPEERAADEEAVAQGRAKMTVREIAFQCLDELQAIADTLVELGIGGAKND